MKQSPLFQFERVIFVDWHGVLSQDPFWTSILSNSAHPLRSKLEEKIVETFSCEQTIHNWMKGAITSQDIVSKMAIKMDRRFGQDFLNKRLNIDCSRMRINIELAEELSKFRPMAHVILATDNMDCFSNTLNRIRNCKKQSVPNFKKLVDWEYICDDFICSSDVGVLKAEDPVSFFGPLLSEYGLTFSDALLLDDRADNCEAFRQQGGCAVQWKIGKNNVNEAIAAVQYWLEKSSNGLVKNSPLFPISQAH